MHDGAFAKAMRTWRRAEKDFIRLRVFCIACPACLDSPNALRALIDSEAAARRLEWSRKRSAARVLAEIPIAPLR
jgi:hypothetical protein